MDFKTILNKNKPKFYSRAGDKGYTILKSGKTISKDSIVVEFVGDLSEFSSILGICKSLIIKLNNKDLLSEAEVLIDIQKDLYIIKNIVMGDSFNINFTKETENLEVTIDDYIEVLKDIDKEILPGGSEASSFIYFASSFSKKIERRIVSYKSKSLIQILPYFNRLSDLLYVMALFVNYRLGINETILKFK